MMLINDDKTLREFVPNAFSNTLPDSPTLFDKVAPFLKSAEDWLIQNFISRDLLEKYLSGYERDMQVGNVLFHARSLVACYAWRNAIPSLDIVITHNGIGVVETNTLKPASKSKMDALVNAISIQVDNQISTLLIWLFRDNKWRISEEGKIFRSCFCQDPAEVIGYNVPGDFQFKTILEKFLFLRPRIISVQETIAREWISFQILGMLLSYKDKSITSYANFEELRFLDRIHSLVKAAITATFAENEGIFDPMFREIRRPLEEAVGLIQSDSGFRDVWRHSEAGQLFRSRNFSNSKSSSAFWL